MGAVNSGQITDTEQGHHKESHHAVVSNSMKKKKKKVWDNTHSVTNKIVVPIAFFKLL